MKTFAELHTGANDDTPAPDEAFEARRLLAQEIRIISDTILARDVSSASCRSALAQLRACRAALAGAGEKQGLLAHTGAGGVERFVAVAHELNPVYGRANPLAPPLDMWRRDGRAHGRARLGYAYEGPPGHVHGGFIAALFDQFLGFAQTLEGKAGMTGKLEVRYVAPTPLEVDLTLEAWVAEASGRLCHVQGHMKAAGKTTARARAMFVEVPKEYLSR